jgi:hypothetical protein
VNGLEYWKLCEQVSVVQAALLMAEVDPAGVQEYVDSWPAEKRPARYDAARTALISAIVRGQLCAQRSFNPDSREGVFEANWNATIIEVSDIRSWLRSKGMKEGFFVSTTSTEPDYLLPQHPNYSPKLAAAVEAWKAVSSDPSPRRRNSIKKALTDWLRMHAGEFQLILDGKLNETGIKEVAKVANWDTKGGLQRLRRGHPPLNNLQTSGFFTARKAPLPGLPTNHPHG